MQLIDVNGNGKRYIMFCKWGRIGTWIGHNTSTTPSSFDTTLEAWKTKFYDCTNNKWEDRDNFTKVAGRYYPIETEYADEEGSEDTVEENVITIPSLLNIRVQQVVDLIFDPRMMQRQMKDLEIDIKKMPLGKISKSSLQMSYSILKEIEHHLDHPSDSQVLQLTTLSNKFYTIIPHDFGTKAPEVIDSKTRLRAKMNQIEALTNIEIAASLKKEVTSTNPTDINYKSLGTTLTPLSSYAPEYAAIRRCVTTGYMQEVLGNRLELLDVFRVQRQGEAKRFEPFSKKQPRMLLWHGSRICNFVGILSQGLKIAPVEAPASGYMFGKGLYFADLIQKSASYTHPDPVDKIGLLLLCEVYVGEHHVIKTPTYITELPEGTSSAKVLAKYAPDPVRKEKMPQGMVLLSGKPTLTMEEDVFLDEAEYIVYDESQVRMAYLVKVKFEPYGSK